MSKSFDDWELHVTSECHVENCKRYKPIPVEIPPPTAPTQVVPIPQHQAPAPASSFIPPLLPPTELMEIAEKLNNQLDQKLNQKALHEIIAKDKKEWKCTHCSITCQSICSWEAHLVSKKHRRNKHKFHTYPGISKDFVKRKYQNSFVRAAETIGNEFIEDGVVFYCKRCDCRMQNKLQLEVHMSSNQHKMNHPIAPMPVADPLPVESNQQLFNFESSSYGYGFRNWSGEQHMFNRNPPAPTKTELQRQNQMEHERQLVERAKTELLARFPFYAINLQNEQNSNQLEPNNIPMPVEAPKPFERFPSGTDFNVSNN